MTGTGDVGRYPCSRCGDQLPLHELLDHIEDHALRRPADANPEEVRT